MDELASIGRGYSTYQLIITVIFSIGLIAGGIYLLTSRSDKPKQSENVPNAIITSGTNMISTVFGSMLIIMGVIAPFAAWVRRKLIRKNPTLAAAAGALDVIKVLDI